MLEAVNIYIVSLPVYMSRPWKAETQCICPQKHAQSHGATPHKPESIEQETAGEEGGHGGSSQVAECFTAVCLHTAVTIQWNGTRMN